MRTIFYMLSFLLVVIITYIIIFSNPPTCVANTTVKSIDRLEYRSAVITLANGQHIYVDQATLAPGDTFCIKWSDGSSKLDLAN